MYFFFPFFYHAQRLLPEVFRKFSSRRAVTMPKASKTSGRRLWAIVAGGVEEMAREALTFSFLLVFFKKNVGKRHWA
jgi:hypothetical protein